MRHRLTRRGRRGASGGRRLSGQRRAIYCRGGGRHLELRRRAPAPARGRPLVERLADRGIIELFDELGIGFVIRTGVAPAHLSGGLINVWSLCTSRTRCTWDTWRRGTGSHRAEQLACLVCKRRL